MTQETAAGVRLILEGTLTMRTVETVRTTLRDAIEQPSGVSAAGIAIDCSGASEVDLTLVQLLIAARISGRRWGRAVSLAAHPDGVLLDTLTRGGFHVVCESQPGEAAAFWFEGADA